MVCTLFGADHAFYISVPKGWVLDNESGVRQGLHMVLYPVGYTWMNSPVIAYGRSVSKASNIHTIDDQVKLTIKDFKDNGSPDYRVDGTDKITLSNGQVAHIYYFSGDQWGNYEAVGYIEEETSINFLVYHAKTKQVFEKTLPSFRAMLFSYKNAYGTTLDETTFKKLQAEASKAINTEDGKEYERKVLNTYGQSLANIMKECTAYASQQERGRFELFFRITPNGNVSEVFVKPETGLTSCVKGRIFNSMHPPHKFETFLQHIDMMITK